MIKTILKFFGRDCSKYGHLFKARYKQIPHPENGIYTIDSMLDKEEIINSLVIKEYVGDVCILCGKVVNVKK